MREWCEFAAAWLMLNILRVLPRPLARAKGSSMARILFALMPRLRKTALFNLRIAFPEWNDKQRKAVIRKMVRNLGWMAAEFARLPRYDAKNIEQLVVLD